MQRDHAVRSYVAASAGLFARRHLKVVALRYALRSLIDRGLACILIIATSPAWAVGAALIFAGDRHSPFFRQTRVGHAHRPFGAPGFTLYKIRSMTWGAEKRIDDVASPGALDDGVRYKQKFDPRISPVGRWIRRLSIDELPQLWNVVKGDMALVGPRPPIHDEVIRYSTPQRARLHGLPGITGPWQVKGRSEISFTQQAIMDRDYLATRSFYGDAKLLLHTIPAVLSTRGAW